MQSRRALVVSLSALATAQGCGNWWETTECYGATDKRYDDAASNDLSAQHELWPKLHGLWIGDLSFFDGDGAIMQPSLYNAAYGYGWPYEYGQYKGFINITVSGSRFYQHNIFVYPAAPNSFCVATAPNVTSTQLDAFGAGVCGVNGGAKSFEAFGTSSYEKDGSMIALPGEGSYGAFVNIARPIDGKTLLYTSTDNATQFHSQTNVFYPDENHRTRTAYGFNLQAAYPGAPMPENPLYYSSLYRERKVDLAEWLAELENAYTAYNVPNADRVPGVPMTTTSCLTGTHAGATPPSSCPDEAKWCTQDPSCSISPYQQPTSKLNWGPIIGIVVGFVALFAALICVIGASLHSDHVTNLKNGFIENVREELLHANKGSLVRGELSTSEITQLHKEIDKDGSGAISKEELWEFFESRMQGQQDEGRSRYVLASASGGANPSSSTTSSAFQGFNLSRRDFNILFAAIDSNRSGQVSVIEFCQFLSGGSKKAKEEKWFNLSSKQLVAANVEGAADASASATTTHEAI